MASWYLMGMILICVCVLARLRERVRQRLRTSGVDVVATNAIAADIARNVAGPDVDVDTLLPEIGEPARLCAQREGPRAARRG